MLITSQDYRRQRLGGALTARIDRVAMMNRYHPAVREAVAILRGHMRLLGCMPFEGDACFDAWNRMYLASVCAVACAYRDLCAAMGDA